MTTGLRALLDRLARAAEAEWAELRREKPREHEERLRKRRIGMSDQRRASPWNLIR